MLQDFRGLKKNDIVRIVALSEDSDEQQQTFTVAKDDLNIQGVHKHQVQFYGGCKIDTQEDKDRARIIELTDSWPIVGEKGGGFNPHTKKKKAHLVHQKKLMQEEL